MVSMPNMDEYRALACSQVSKRLLSAFDAAASVRVRAHTLSYMYMCAGTSNYTAVCRTLTLGKITSPEV